MCSFLIYNFLVESLSKYNYFLKFRGPDYTNTYKHNFKNLFFTFLHNLLNITGSVTYQPFIKNDIICLYDGEIYNHKLFGSFDSDGECLINAYEKYNTNFIKYLNGEFSIVLFDFNKKIYLFYQQMYSQLNHFGITLQINIWVFHLINLVYCILGAIRPHN